MATNTHTSPFQTRVGFLGNPNSAEPFKFWRVVPWTDANLQRLKDLGFNTIQVNVAWGPRPDDEPLNLEDVVALLPEIFARDFPEVDDILVYTYDQDAWLCSEFGPCPRCLGIPLHERLPHFLNHLASRWKAVRSQGRL